MDWYRNLYESGRYSEEFLFRFCRSFTLIGTVTGTTGGVSGITIGYTINGEMFTTTTDALGNYSISAPRCAHVVITPTPGIGVTVTPIQRVICQVCGDVFGLDFTLTPIVGTTFLVSGSISGLTSNVGIAVNYMVNNVPSATVTDANGMYSFAAPSGASVFIVPSAQSGFSASPTNRVIASVTGNTAGQNFVYTPM